MDSVSRVVGILVLQFLVVEAGIFVGPHSVYRNMVSIIFTEDYVEKGQEKPIQTTPQQGKKESLLQVKNVELQGLLHCLLCNRFRIRHFVLY